MTLPPAPASFEDDADLNFACPEKLWLASSAEPVAPGAVRGSGPVRFKTVTGLELEITVPAVKLALYELGRVWPHALTLADLAERVTERLGEASNAAELSRLLFESAASAAIRAFAQAPRSVRAPSQKPEATALARLEAMRGGEVTNLHSEPVKIEVALHRRLLSLLDGTRDREALARALADELESGRLSVPGIEPGKRAHWEGLLGREVDAGLEKLARYALLIA